MTRRVVIAGAGIVGAALAAELSVEDDLEVTVLERGPSAALMGSTGYAPGFVGVFNEKPVLTALAQLSADAYEAMEHSGRAGFDRVGGLEIATTPAGMDELRRRARLAAEQGVTAQLLDAQQAAAAAPDLVNVERCVGGVLYAADGTARSGVITSALRDRAARNGAHFRYDTAVTGIDTHAGHVSAVHTSKDRLAADEMVIACGIWGPAVAALAGQHMPLVPVAHPYVYGPPHGAATASSPFVRWPEHHVYARNHGDRLGLGTYDHAPLPLDIEALGIDAEQPWPRETFDAATERALDLLPPGQRFTPAEHLNGAFSMTADNQPLVGPVGDIAGLWSAEAVWVTHAAGAARSLAELITGKPTTITGLDTLRPDRFADRTNDELHASALRLYRDIYATT